MRSKAFQNCVNDVARASGAGDRVDHPVATLNRQVRHSSTVRRTRSPSNHERSFEWIQRAHVTLTPQASDAPPTCGAAVAGSRGRRHWNKAVRAAPGPPALQVTSASRRAQTMASSSRRGPESHTADGDGPCRIPIAPRRNPRQLGPPGASGSSPTDFIPGDFQPWSWSAPSRAGDFVKSARGPSDCTHGYVRVDQLCLLEGQGSRTQSRAGRPPARRPYTLGKETILHSRFTLNGGWSFGRPQAAVPASWAASARLTRFADESGVLRRVAGIRLR